MTSKPRQPLDPIQTTVTVLFALGMALSGYSIGLRTADGRTLANLEACVAIADDALTEAERARADLRMLNSWAREDEKTELPAVLEVTDNAP